jgi:hypothetical protein
MQSCRDHFKIALEDAIRAPESQNGPAEQRFDGLAGSLLDL